MTSNYSTGANQNWINSFASSKTLTLMEEIITIIKGMDTLKQENVPQQLRRTLLRSMDALVELKSDLLQLKVSQAPDVYLTRYGTVYPLLCPACNLPWPHTD